MMTFAFLFLGLILGGAGIYLWARGEILRLKSEIKAQGESELKLKETFESLSAQALRDNNASFMDLAKLAFEKLHIQSQGDLSKRQQSIQELVNPLQKSLDEFDRKVQGLEKSREGAYASLSERLKHLLTAQSKLEGETANLVKALRAPNVRGQWGEMQLRKTVEIAGMINHVDFIEQVSMDSGRLRPDMVIQLPNERKIIVDAKAPLTAFLNSLEKQDPDAQNACLKDHARHIRDHLTKLGSKTYWKELDVTPEFVVLFLPGETFFSAALEKDPELIEFGMKNQVILATPTTLIALLKAVAYGWSQESVTREAKTISELGATLYERMAVLAGHVTDIGRGLDRSVTAYNKAVNSIEKRVLPTARKFKEMKSISVKEIPAIEILEKTITEARSEELIGMEAN